MGVAVRLLKSPGIANRAGDWSRGNLPMRRSLLAMIFALSAILPAAAADVSLYTVAGVPVEATAENAAAARTPAIASGEKRAAQIMMRRLTQSADYGRLPALSDTELQTLVRGIEINDERIGGNRYTAKVTVNFNANALRSLLRNAGIPFTEATAKPILVVPVLDIDGRRLMWEDANPWREAWAQRANDGALQPITVALGDAQDAQTIDATSAASVDEAKLRALANRYQMSDIAVAAAQIKRNPSNWVMQVTVTRLGGGDATMVLSYNGQGDNYQAVMDEAARDIAGRLEDRWKQAAAMPAATAGAAPGDRQKLAATVPLTALGDWLIVRDRLARVSGLNRVDVHSLTKTDAQLVLTYTGDPQRLTLMLSQRDLALEQGPDGYWTLKPASKR